MNSATLEVSPVKDHVHRLCFKMDNKPELFQGTFHMLLWGTKTLDSCLADPSPIHHGFVYNATSRGRSPLN